MLLSGCGKAKLEADNAALKTQLEKLQQQLQDSSKQIGAQQATINYSQSQLDEAKKRADKSDVELKSVNSQIETQKEKIQSLTKNVSDCQKDKEKDEKDLERYRDKTKSAVGGLKALRSTFEEQTIQFDSYSHNYLETKMETMKLVDALPESEVKRKILGTLQFFSDIKNTWENANNEMTKRIEKAQENDESEYRRIYAINVARVASLHRQLVVLGAQKENLVTKLNRDLKISSSKQEIDQQLKKLQDLMNGQKT